MGTFIDAKTLVERQTKINSAIVETVKNISKDVKSYSQGSISYFELLDFDQSNGIYRVTARVDVIVEDFKAYIRKSAMAQQDIPVGLFANMSTEDDQLKEKYNLLIDNIIEPLATGEVYNVELGAPLPFKDSPLNIEAATRKLNKLSISERDAIAFTMTTRLDPKFKANMINTLENISDDKKKVTKSTCSSKAKYYDYVECIDHYYWKYDNKFDLFNKAFRLSIFDKITQTTDIYLMSEIADYSIIREGKYKQSLDKSKQYAWITHSRGMCSVYNPDVSQKALSSFNINFYDSYNNIIKFIEVPNGPYHVIADWAEENIGFMIVSNRLSGFEGSNVNYPVLFNTGNQGHLISRQLGPRSNCSSKNNSQKFSHVAVYDELTFWIVLKLDKDTLRNAKSMKVEYIQ